MIIKCLRGTTALLMQYVLQQIFQYLWNRLAFLLKDAQIITEPPENERKEDWAAVEGALGGQPALLSKSFRICVAQDDQQDQLQQYVWGMLLCEED